MVHFNYADVPILISNKLEQGQTIETVNNKKYLVWHDLIDIKVSLVNDPSILLTSRVPTPLWGVNPRSILTQIDPEWWDRTRRKVYASNDYHCACCGVHQDKQKGWVRGQLDAHELYDVDWKTGEVKLIAIVPLCKFCHNAIHFGRLTAQLESGKIQQKTFYSIIQHANTILEKSGLPRKNWDASVDDNIYNISWETWRLTLCIEGENKSFYSLYKDLADLEAHY